MLTDNCGASESSHTIKAYAETNCTGERFTIDNLTVDAMGVR
jgi:hypothetical protein